MLFFMFKGFGLSFKDLKNGANKYVERAINF